MVRVINWAKQNLVTVFEIVEILFRALRLFVMGLARLVAFTPSTSDDAVIAKLNDALSKLEEPWKKAKAFLLGIAQ